MTITELKEQKAQREAEMRQRMVEEKLERERKEKEKEDAGISWGMSEDAEDEEPSAVNPFAVTTNEELFLDDPKKTLRGFFEREGLDLEYRCDELSPGVFICRVELPVDDEYGKNITCEVQHKGKKKECVVQCALEACRILDRHGVLRQANQESRRVKKVENSDDSDDDNFFDRTGDVEKKRLKKLGPGSSEALTYEQLMEQEREIADKIQTKEHKLELMVQMEKRQKAQNDDDLDQFMSNLSSLDHKVDKFAISTIKTEIQQMKIEHQKIQKLVNVAKPSIVLPPVTKGKLPLFGKRNSLGRNIRAVIAVKKAEAEAESEFKVEEDEDDGRVEESTADAAVEKAKECSAAVVESQVEAAAVKNADEPAEKKTKIESPKVKIPEIPATSCEKSPSTTPAKPSSPPAPQESQEASSKKRKNRIRIRNRLRENIDMDDNDEYIDDEKVSTWVAPEGQSGDGTTHLNDKYGY